jgi:hypothetical protein
MSSFSDEERNTPAETPSAKHQFSTNQSFQLVCLLQALISRISVLERASKYVQCRIDRTLSSTTLEERQKEITDDTIEKLQNFINSVDEVERPSQSIVVNVAKSRGPDSRGPRAVMYRTAYIVGVVAGIVGGIIIGLREIGLLK